MTPPVPMSFADEAELLTQLRPGTDGLIIEDSGRAGLFLPSVWEEIPTARPFLTHLKLKAGMAANHFSPRFTAQRFRSIEVKGRMADHPPLAVLATTRDLLGWKPLRAATAAAGV